MTALQVCCDVDVDVDGDADVDVDALLMCRHEIIVVGPRLPGLY
tara:strand:+ start:723 stop:854 length:132 start_codon:yes stop_codon:yes gene_type:complete